MKKTRLIIIFLWLVPFLCLEAMAQGFSDLQQKAMKTIEIKNPRLRLIGKEERDKQVYYQYGPKDESVSLLIFYGTSRKEAVDHMRAAFKILSMGPGKKLRKLGDEAYAWETDGGGPGGGVRFRKANVYIDLVAPSLAEAEDLARELAKLIPGK
jgi:hypothetical protein